MATNYIPSSNFPNYNPFLVPARPKVARCYQKELLHAALNDNIIVVLGTGTGKTHIACMLIEEMKKEGRLDNGVKVVFLVPTDALVIQQADVLRKDLQHLLLRVGMYMGGKSLSAWDQVRWKQELNDIDILVMIGQTALNSFLTNVINLSQVGLLIIDECHHARKKHPYREIMRRYEAVIDENRPKILGLSASIITRNIRDLHKIEQEIRELEEILHARALTTTDINSLSIHSTNAQETIVVYKAFSYEAMKSLFKSLKEYMSFINSLLGAKNSKLFPGWEFQPKNTAEICKTAISDCLFACDELGAIACYMTANLCIKGLRDYKDNYLKSNLTALSRCEVGFISNTICLLSLLEKNIQPYCADSQYSFSPKVLKLHEMIKTLKNDRFHTQQSNNYANYSYSTDQHASDATCNTLCGIIFTARRVPATILKYIIMDEFKLDDIRCGHLVGHGSFSIVPESDMNISKQEVALDKFRRGDYNLLIATNVLEEGLDVPSCNLVIRFDLPQSPRSYIQSKGRARYKDSKLYHMILESEKLEQEAILDLFKRIEEKLTEKCKSRDLYPIETSSNLDANTIEPYIIPSTGARITSESAIQLINGYCQRLIKDPFYNMRPFTLTTQVENASIYGFNCQLLLPEKSPVTGIIDSGICNTSEMAKKTVYLKACVELHKLGEIDDNLHYVNSSLSSNNGCTTELERELDAKFAKVAINDLKNVYYEKAIPPEFVVNGPQISSINKYYVYYFILANKLTHAPYCGYTDHESPSALNNRLSYVGIITNTELPIKKAKIPTYEVYYRGSQFKVTLKRLKKHTEINNYMWTSIYQFHHSTFSDILKCNTGLFQFKADKSLKSFWVIPLTTNSKSKIDLDLVTLHEFSSPTGPNILEDYINRVITVSYHIKESDIKFFHILGIDHTITPLSKFPDTTKSPTYQTYLLDKHKVKFAQDTELHQPGLIAEHTSSYINLTVDRYKTPKRDGLTVKQEAYKKHPLIFFPSLCTLHPITSNIWRLCILLPSMLSRLEEFLLSYHFASNIQTKSASPLSLTPIFTSLDDDDDDEEDYYDINNDNCYNTNDRYSNISSSTSETGHLGYTSNIDNRYTLAYSLQPSIISVLTAFTACGAGDIMNYERLEFIGDSFLKFISSLYLFTHSTIRSEGELSQQRNKLISNDTLHVLAVDKGLVHYMRAAHFDVRKNYLPPGCFLKDDAFNDFVVNNGIELNKSKEGLSLISRQISNQIKDHELINQQLPFFYQQLSDKTTADCVEALIGAYAQSCGIQQALLFLSWLGLNLFPRGIIPQTITDKYISSYSQTMGHFLSPTIAFREYFSAYKSKEMSNNSHIFADRSNYTDSIEGVSKESLRLIRLLQSTMLNYSFTNELLLVEALTHPSYMCKITSKGQIRYSYQNLEFLGDAILDYMTCVYIYNRFELFEPEELTLMRSAIVNNNRLATLSLFFGIHLCILHSSEKLDIAINQAYSNLMAAMDSQDFIAQDYGRVSYPKPLGDILESIIAAVFLDSQCSLDTTWRIFGPIFEPLIEKLATNDSVLPKNPVSLLHEFVVKDNLDISCEREDYNNYICTIHIKDINQTFKERGSSVKTAKYSTAQLAIDYFKKLPGRPS